MKPSLIARLRSLGNRFTEQSRSSINEGLYDLTQVPKAIWPLNSFESQEDSMAQACPAIISKKSRNNQAPLCHDNDITVGEETKSQKKLEEALKQALEQNK